VLTPAQELVEQMQNVLSKITVLYVLVKMDILAIHSVDAIPIHVRNLTWTEKQKYKNNLYFNK
jgi:hypothetical protein